MRKAYARPAAQPNSRAEKGFRALGNKFPLKDRLAPVFKRIWPTKADIRLHELTGAEDRTARNWLAARNGMSADDFVALLHDERGLEILSVAMGEARPSWWRKIQRSHRLAELRATIAQQEKSIRQLELQFGEED